MENSTDTAVSVHGARGGVRGREGGQGPVQRQTRTDQSKGFSGVPRSHPGMATQPAEATLSFTLAPMGSPPLPLLQPLHARS